MQYSTFSPNETFNIFLDEISTLNGKVTDRYIDKRRLFARSVLSYEEDIKPRDAVTGGVALRQIDDEVAVYPYILRQVCRNGQIMAHGSHEQMSRIVVSDWLTTEAAIREATRRCSEPDVFQQAVAEIRRSPKDTSDFLIVYLQKLPSIHPELADAIISHFMKHEEPSRFGLMNAVTAVARDVKDPEERWDLEELGGAIGIGAPIPLPKLPTSVCSEHSAYAHAL